MESFDGWALSFILEVETLGSVLQRGTMVRACLVERTFVYLKSRKKTGRSETSDKVVVSLSRQVNLSKWGVVMREC